MGSSGLLKKPAFTANPTSKAAQASKAKQQLKKVCTGANALIESHMWAVPLVGYINHLGVACPGAPAGLHWLKSAFDCCLAGMYKTAVARVDEALKQGVPKDLIDQLLNVPGNQYTFLHWKLFAETNTMGTKLYAPETIELMKQGQYPPDKVMKGPTKAELLDDLLDDDFWSDDEDKF